jgi:hypothetical protein
MIVVNGGDVAPLAAKRATITILYCILYKQRPREKRFGLQHQTARRAT